MSPANGSTLDAASGALVLKVNAASREVRTGRGLRLPVPGAERQHGHRREPHLVTAVGGRTRRSITKTTYGWHVRAEQGTAFGPWSDTWTFITPDQPEGYIRGGELYDPLVNGKTIGQVVGSVTFIPGQGVRINDLGSYIQYPLQATVAGGEFSFLVTGLETDTEGGKTKVMAMAEGLSDITTNDRRFTIEKRGDQRRGSVPRDHEQRSDRDQRRRAPDRALQPESRYTSGRRSGAAITSTWRSRTAVRTAAPSTTSARATAASTTRARTTRSSADPAGRGGARQRQRPRDDHPAGLAVEPAAAGLRKSVARLGRWAATAHLPLDQQLPASYISPSPPRITRQVPSLRTSKLRPSSRRYTDRHRSLRCQTRGAELVYEPNPCTFWRAAVGIGRLRACWL